MSIQIIHLATNGQCFSCPLLVWSACLKWESGILGHDCSALVIKLHWALAYVITNNYVIFLPTFYNFLLVCWIEIFQLGLCIAFSFIFLMRLSIFTCDYWPLGIPHLWTVWSCLLFIFLCLFDIYLVFVGIFIYSAPYFKGYVCCKFSISFLLLQPISLFSTCLFLVFLGFGSFVFFPLWNLIRLLVKLWK